MTRTEAMRLLVARHPRHDVSLTVACWVYKSGKQRTIYQVGVQPGADGSECQLFDAATIDEVVRQALTGSSCVSNALLDEQFAEQVEAISAGA